MPAFKGLRAKKAQGYQAIHKWPLPFEQKPH